MSNIHERHCTNRISMKYQNFLRSYISDRSQYVSLFNSTSFINNVMCGVLQGSVLCPVLCPISYKLYINDVSDKLCIFCRRYKYSSKEIENV